MFRLKKQYYGEWKSREDIIQDFFCDYEGSVREEDKEAAENFPRHDQIIFACNVAHSAYEESCVVLYVEGGKLFFNEASHCSCYGYENQWDPDEVTWFQLWKMRLLNWDEDYYSDEEREAARCWRTILGNNTIFPVDVVGEDPDTGYITLSRDVRGMQPDQFFVLVPNILITAMGPQGGEE